MVQVDGSVTVCCLDEHLENKLGNLRDTPLAELWNGALVNDWRRAHIEGRHQDSGPLCSRCNWRSAGAAPEDVLQRWLKGQDPELAAAWRERKDEVLK